MTTRPSICRPFDATHPGPLGDSTKLDEDDEVRFEHALLW